MSEEQLETYSDLRRFTTSAYGELRDQQTVVFNEFVPLVYPPSFFEESEEVRRMRARVNLKRNILLWLALVVPLLIGFGFGFILGTATSGGGQ